MTPFSSFYPFILPFVPGCPDPVVDQALRNIARDFCDFTDLITTIQSKDSVVNQPDYAPTAFDSDHALVRIVGVGWNANWLTPSPFSSVSDIRALRGDFADVTAAKGTPTTFYVKTPTATSFSLYPIPDRAVTGIITIKLSSKPSMTTLLVEDELFNYWVEAIAAGTIAELMKTPGQPYTGDPTPYLTRYISERSKAKRVAEKGRVQVNLRVTPLAFAGTQRR